MRIKWEDILGVFREGALWCADCADNEAEEFSANVDDLVLRERTPGKGEILVCTHCKKEISTSVKRVERGVAFTKPGPIYPCEWVCIVCGKGHEIGVTNEQPFPLDRGLGHTCQFIPKEMKKTWDASRAKKSISH
jgi:hypothetical protein